MKTTLTDIKCLEQKMKSKTAKQMWEKQTQNRSFTKQKLITEFTPSTGLRLRVPLQWVLFLYMLNELVVAWVVGRNDCYPSHLVLILVSDMFNFDNPICNKCVDYATSK